MNYSQNQTLNSNKIFQGRQRDKLKISTNDVPWLNVRNDTCDLSRALQLPLPSQQRKEVTSTIILIPFSSRLQFQQRVAHAFAHVISFQENSPLVENPPYIHTWHVTMQESYVCTRSSVSEPHEI